jgi:hypothetical protein
MIQLPGSVRVYLCLTPCDMRKSFDRLHALVRGHLELDAFRWTPVCVRQSAARLWCKLAFARLKVRKGSQAASAAFHSSDIVAFRFPNFPVLN